MARTRRQAPARAAVLPFPGGRAGRVRLSRLLPTRRSLLAGLVIALAGAAAYAGARQTSVFAVESIAVEGAPPEVARAVEKALAPALGRSLLELGFDDLDRPIRSVPAVAAASVDRAFPHTLRVVVTLERPVAVLRQGAASWLVAESGRIVAPLDRGARSKLPRIWLGRDVRVRVGEHVAGRPALAVKALAAVSGARLPGRPAAARSAPGELTVVLRSGLELRLGDATDLPLKVAVAEGVARRLTPPLPGETAYLDVSVPERPVARS